MTQEPEDVSPQPPARERTANELVVERLNARFYYLCRMLGIETAMHAPLDTTSIGD